jgi:hypothetical protein
MTPKQKKLIRDRCNSYRIQDKRKGRDFSNNIKADAFMEQLEWQEYKCWYTGLPLSIEDASAERLDCSQGHHFENIVIVNARLNFSRGNKNFVSFCRYLKCLGILEPTAAALLD